MATAPHTPSPATQSAQDTAPAHDDGQARTLALEIVSLGGSIWSGQVREASLPGSLGRFGVMARHLPMLSILREGLVHIVPAQGEPLDVYVSGGYVEVQPGKIMVMADLAQRGADIDAARAKAARESVASPMAQSLTDAAYLRLHMELMQRYGGSLRHTRLP
ncbi:ATP synthase F1 subunit epsilon [Stenotrophomonas sp. MMGLT7]|uniref:ATP synthase F1 subunit epsilon n=1 Tax=Stenotrophomonas sp. MMGLT7 TaxID=2901227 RepID=UPI001E419EF1|nr:ATP synthase F1 subunit epsilon [Stenotrophomonas sp. MMGLT7]MCD7098325.1 ATP synthase F1 subunit epsilon [Stenotrophomonas sp. MMGLT7]